MEVAYSRGIHQTVGPASILTIQQNNRHCCDPLKEVTLLSNMRGSLKLASFCLSENAPLMCLKSGSQDSDTQTRIYVKVIYYESAPGSTYN